MEQNPMKRLSDFNAYVCARVTAIMAFEASVSIVKSKKLFPLTRLRTEDFLKLQQVQRLQSRCESAGAFKSDAEEYAAWRTQSAAWLTRLNELIEVAATQKALEMAPITRDKIDENNRLGNIIHRLQRWLLLADAMLHAEFELAVVRAMRAKAQREV